MAIENRNEAGQATTEYILLVSIVVSLFMFVTSAMGKLGIGKKMVRPLQVEYAAMYRVGHPKGKSFEEGSPAFHPRFVGGENNFRLFANPEP